MLDVHYFEIVIKTTKAHFCLVSSYNKVEIKSSFFLCHDVIEIIAENQKLTSRACQIAHSYNHAWTPANGD